MEKLKSTYKILDRRPQGKKSHRRPMDKWKDCIKINLKGIASEDVKLIHLVWDKVEWWVYIIMVMNLLVLQ
jgi:hypothetical protein